MTNSAATSSREDIGHLMAVDIRYVACGQLLLFINLFTVWLILALCNASWVYKYPCCIANFDFFLVSK